MDDAQAIRQRLEEGLRHHKSGRFDEAEAIYREVLQDNPVNVDALHFLGLIAHQRQDYPAAVDLIRQAVDGDPARPTFHFNLGAAQLALGHKEAALVSYKQASALKPDWPEAHYNAGSLSGQLGNPAEAEAALTAALKLTPNHPETHSSLAAALNLQGRPREAKQSAETALDLKSSLSEAWTNLGNAEEKLGDMMAAEKAHRKSVEVNPGYGPGYYNLGNTYADLWRQDEAVRCFQRALEINPGFENAQDNMLLNLHYDPKATEESLLATSLDCEAKLSPTAVTAGHPNDRNQERTLRVGYVSPDFRTHSCAYFLDALFNHHDRSNVFVVAYSNVAKPDDYTDRLKGMTDLWRDISGLADEDAAGLILDDEIDILVDLAGRSNNQHLGLFRRKPAPIQLSWLGYPGTTGVEAIDYRVTDDVADPVGQSDDNHTESLIRLPDGFHCYSPPRDCPETGPLPSEAKGTLTFGSFNNLSKVTEETIRAWSEILEHTPQSTLVLKSRALDHPATKENLLGAFRAAGIEGNRLDLIGWIPRSGNPLAAYHQIDIALDTFPYNGTTTTFEALWMGVPVITCKGSRHAGRVGASILTMLGLEEFVAGTWEDYIDKSLTLAQDTNRLNSLRKDLRVMLKRSPLMDGPRFSKKLEDAYRRIWLAWCRQTTL